MRRLSMKSKRRKSETTNEGDSEEDGVDRSTANEFDEMKKGKEDGDSMDSSRRSVTKKRPYRSRHNLKGIDDNAAKADEEDGQEIEEDENKNTGKGGANKRLKKDDSRASSSIRQDGNDKKEYEVERIIGQRLVKGRRQQFLVRWKGYDENSDTWELAKDLNCPELIEEFLAEDVENVEDKSKKTEDSPKGGKAKSPKMDKKAKKSKVGAKKMLENNKEINTLDETKNDKDNQKEFEVEKIIEVHFKKNKTKQFLIRWKGFSPADDTWEPEENLNCPDLIEKFMQKVEKAKTADVRELRTNRPHTKRYTLATHEHGRRLSRRNMNKQRATYHECDE